MKGSITLWCDETGTHVRTDMSEMEKYDPLFLVHAIGKSLGLTYHDYAILGLADIDGVLDPTIENIAEEKYES